MFGYGGMILAMSGVFGQMILVKRLFLLPLIPGLLDLV